MENIVYLNGSLMPLSQASLSPLDYGFFYGYGLFETMRAYSGHIFCLERHLARLYSSAKFLGVGLENIPDLKEVLYSTLRANELSGARIRLTLSGGHGEPVPDVAANQNPTVFIIARGYVPYPDQVYQHGIKAIVSRIRRNTQSPASGIKSLSYLDSLLARREARSDGADEAILLNEQGLVSEGSTSNIFMISGNMLFTPGDGSGIIPGVTREVILELAISKGIKTVEQKITLEDLIQADEVFCTNSLVEVLPISRIGEQSVGSGEPGIITRKLMAAYKELVERAIVTFGETGAS